MDPVYFNVLFTFCFVAFIAVCRILRAKDIVPDTELFFQSSSKFVKNILDKTPTLQQKYTPIYLWGKSGHIQSMLLSIIGRFGSKEHTQKQRVELVDEHGAVIYYDMFYKEPNAVVENDDLILVVPGICNTGETDYIHEFSCYMNRAGYDVAVLNHVGALKNVKITYPRIFSYGKTNDLDLVVNDLYSKHQKKMVGIGFSLGAQLLMKYLGESKDHQDMFSVAASVCQGYNLEDGCLLLQEWKDMRWFYNLAITKNMLKVINRHKDFFVKHSHKKTMKLDWNRIESSTSLHELDVEFTLKVFGEKEEILDWYRKESCSRHMTNIDIPVLLLNAKDDPLIPELLHKYAKNLVEEKENCLFVVTPYGGHLGFFEGGYILPNRVSWLDRFLLEYVNGALDGIKSGCL